MNIRIFGKNYSVVNGCVEQSKNDLHAMTLIRWIADLDNISEKEKIEICKKNIFPVFSLCKHLIIVGGHAIYKEIKGIS